METYLYKPDSDTKAHEISAELLLDEGGALVYTVLSDGEGIGEVDVQVLSDERAFVSGVGPGEQINNGYLRPASLVIASCLRDRYPGFRTLFDIEDQPIRPSD